MVYITRMLSNEGIKVSLAAYQEFPGDTMLKTIKENNSCLHRLRRTRLTDANEALDFGGKFKRVRAGCDVISYDATI